ncbi:serine/threonine protein kinase [Thermobifida alba]|uniref:Serine/threonine protein kinase n=2 Tax=Thermobifida alba TaxID=53522 RepID=A0ABY4L6R2_THEAE|nr:serine/threonine protein kinase [Thermobifida alba]
MIITLFPLLVVVGAVILVVIVRRSRPTAPPPLPGAAEAKALHAGLAPADPDQVGPYRILGRLGAGGMGRVYLGRSPGGRDVAVKVVHPELAQDPPFRRRFATEVATARRVGGFYTAQVVDADVDADPPWLATAYVPGPSLHALVHEHGPLPADAVAVLGAGLAEGLAAVHACRIVHRDLKPGNVLLAVGGPRLIDFGIARALDATSHTRTSTLLGTAAFMSPEQITGAEVGPASDVFSLGCVLAFAATGRGPFGEGPAHAITHRIVHDEPDLSGLADPLKDLVAACLAKDPADRPAPEHILAVCRPLPPTAQSRSEEASEASEASTGLVPSTRVLPQDVPPPAPPVSPADSGPVGMPAERTDRWSVPDRPEGAWPEALTEVIALYRTRVLPRDAPPRTPWADPRQQ